MHDCHPRTPSSTFLSLHHSMHLKPSRLSMAMRGHLSPISTPSSSPSLFLSSPLGAHLSGCLVLGELLQTGVLEDMSCRGGLSAKADATISTAVPAPEVPHSAPFQSTISLAPRSMHASHPTPHLFAACAASTGRLLTSPDTITRFGHAGTCISHHGGNVFWMSLDCRRCSSLHGAAGGGSFL